MKIAPLSPVLGALVDDVDLREELSERSVAELLEAFKKYGLLLFRNQDIDPEQQTNLVRHFGPLSTNTPFMKKDAQVYFVSNHRDDYPLGYGQGELLFHSDHSYVATPDVKAILLYAFDAAELPSEGGETCFVSGQRAYDELSPELKSRIESLHALHGVTYTNPRGDVRFHESADFDPKAETAIQPLVWPHPETGRNVLFVNECFTDRIVELDSKEGEELLQKLFAHLYSEERQYVHEWKQGDILVWDNLALQHARRPFDPTQNRTLRKSYVGVPAAVTASVAG